MLKSIDWNSRFRRGWVIQNVTIDRTTGYRTYNKHLTQGHVDEHRRCGEEMKGKSRDNAPCPTKEIFPRYKPFKKETIYKLLQPPIPPYIPSLFSTHWLAALRRSLDPLETIETVSFAFAFSAWFLSLVASKSSVPYWWTVTMSSSGQSGKPSCNDYWATF